MIFTIITVMITATTKFKYISLSIDWLNIKKIQNAILQSVSVNQSIAWNRVQGLGTSLRHSFSETCVVSSHADMGQGGGGGFRVSLRSTRQTSF